MKTILVTGAHGFIGRHVARHLAESGHAVTGIGHGAWTPDQWRGWGLDRWISANVGLEQLLEFAGHPDAVIHCAGSGSVGFSATEPFQDYQRNVATTATVLEFMRQRSPEAALVLTSSAAVYGHATVLPIPEKADTEPVSVYGSHKLIAERLCAMHAQVFATRIAIVRLFSVYGNGLRKQLLWDACCKIRRGETEFGGTGKEQRDWVNASDAAGLLALAVEHASPECPVVNGGSGIGTTVSAIVRRVFAESGSGLTPTFSGARRPGDPPVQIANVTRAREWNWTPKILIQDGVAGYARWFDENC